MPSRILPLSQDAISQINSSKQITSLSGVVIALLENALDADAFKVEVSVNFARGSCVVEDNGCGIPATEFLEHGGLGKYHHTSKAGCRQALHGNTGTYLASLAALSMVSITSRHLVEDMSATMIMHQGRIIARHLPSLPANDLTAFGTHGTRVSVNDLFGNMPVRVKQRALLSAQGTGADDRTWLDLKRDVSALLLAWRTPCSVKLRDTNAIHRNVTMSGSHSTVSSALTERNLNTLHGQEVRYDLRDAFPLLFQAGLAPLETRARWVPVSASTSKLSCHGLVCLDPFPTRLCQFVSIGIHPCSSASGHSIIYETINKLFSNSSFGTVAIKNNPGPGRLGLHLNGENASRTDRTSKGIDRWPMFVLQCKLKDENENIVRGNDMNQLRSILDVLEAMIRQWLKVNGHHPRQRRTASSGERKAIHGTMSSPLQHDLGNPDLGAQRTLSSSHTLSSRFSTSTAIGLHDIEVSNKRHRGASPAKRQRTDFDVDHLSKIKSGKGADAAPFDVHQNPAPVESTHFSLPPLEPGSLSRFFKTTKSLENSPITTHTNPVVEQSRSLEMKSSSDDFGSVSEADLLQAASFADGAVSGLPCESFNTHVTTSTQHDDDVEWKDPITGEIFLVNSRNGTVVPKGRPGSASNAVFGTVPRRPISTNMATTAAIRPLTLNGRGSSAGVHTSHQTVPTFLRDWQNPVFPRQSEQEIPITSLSGEMTGISETGGQCCTHNDPLNSLATAGSSTRSKLSKAQLQHTKVISQVDAKFILCSMCSTDEGVQTLVLVDQHAASERIILESLFSKLCLPLEQTSPAGNLRTNLDCASAVDTVLLDQPLLFEVTTEESDLFRIHAPLFARFGILYDLHLKAGSRTYHKLATCALPPVIAERCKLFPKLLIDLLRTEIWSRVDARQGLPKAQVEASHEQHSWLDRIGSCPKALVDMLNSRACRSAVMFNDVLSIRECEELMVGLAKCAFPFMCAHGRVSMVPIGIIGGVGKSILDEHGGRPVSKHVEVDEKPFSKAFVNWRTRGLGDVAS